MKKLVLDAVLRFTLAIGLALPTAITKASLLAAAAGDGHSITYPPTSVSAQAGPDPFPSEMSTYYTWPVKENSPARLQASVSGGSGFFSFNWYRIPGGTYYGSVGSETWLGSGNPYLFTVPTEGYGWWQFKVVVTDLVTGETKSAETGFHVLPDPPNRLDPDGNPPTVNPVLWVPRDSFPNNVVPQPIIDHLNRSLRRIQAGYFDIFGKAFRMNLLEVIVSTKSEYDLYGGDRASPYYADIVMGQAIQEATTKVRAIPYTRQVLILAWGAGGWAGAWGPDIPMAGIGEWGIVAATGARIPTLEPDVGWQIWEMGKFDPNAGTIAHELNHNIGWDDPHDFCLEMPQTPLEIAMAKALPWLYETMTDTKNPTVSITNPVDGAVVSGTIIVSVTALDVDSGIDAVVLTIDDYWFDVSTTPPYTFSVDTTKIGHGLRRLTAIAYDRAGRIAEAEIRVKVQNQLPSCPNTYPQDSGYVCYYDGIGFSGDYLGTMIDPPQILAADGTFGFLMQHDFGTDEIAFGKSERISGMWRARVNFLEGWYKFIIQADDGVRFYVNAELILDEWQDQVAIFEPVVWLSGYTDIKVEWYQNLGGAHLKIRWQPVTPPVPSVNPASWSAPACGGSTTVSLSTGSGCSWTASSNQGWLTVNPASGTGSATLTLNASSNSTGSTRTATVTIWGSGWSAIVHVTQPSCQQNLLFFEDFEDLAGWSRTGLWHIRDIPSCFTCTPNLQGRFAQYAREDRCSYDEGRRTRGILTSPAIKLESNKDYVLRFDYAIHVEYNHRATRDRAYAQMRLGRETRPGRISWGSWKTVWSRSSRNPSPECDTFRFQFNTSRSNQVQIRFVFDSVNALANDHPGWAIDNVTVFPAEFLPAGLDVATEFLEDEELEDLGEVVFLVYNAPNPVMGLSTTFVVEGVEAELIRVEVYNLWGNLVFAGEAIGNELTWNTLDLSGRLVANGVYLYIAQVKVGDTWVPSPVEKLLILR